MDQKHHSNNAELQTILDHKEKESYDKELPLLAQNHNNVRHHGLVSTTHKDTGKDFILWRIDDKPKIQQDWCPGGRIEGDHRHFAPS